MFLIIGGTVRRISRSGSTAWEAKLDGGVLGGVIIVNDTLAATTTAGRELYFTKAINTISSVCTLQL